MEHKIHVGIEVMIDVLDIFLFLKRGRIQLNFQECLFYSLPSSFSRNFSLTMYGTKTLLICTQADSLVSRDKELFDIDGCECFRGN